MFAVQPVVRLELSVLTGTPGGIDEDSDAAHILQMTANDSTQNYLHDAFVTQLQRVITSSLDRVGKGWFNINESNHQTYEYSKLKKLLTCMRFMMEDTLRYLVLGSLSAFTKFTTTACNVDITVKSTNDVRTVRPPTARRQALLSVSLTVDPETSRVVFSDDVTLIPGQMVALMLRGISSSEGLGQLEPLVMSKLYWAYRPKLQTVHPQEEEVLAMTRTVQTAWERVVEPLVQYKGLYAKLEPVLQRDNKDHVAVLAEKGEDLTLADVQAELAAAEKMLATVQRDVPTMVRTFVHHACHMAWPAVTRCE